MKCIRMYVLPMPEIKRGMEPTNFTFKSEDEVQEFINNGLQKAKNDIKKDMFFGRDFQLEIEVTFLKVY